MEIYQINCFFSFQYTPYILRFRGATPGAPSVPEPMIGSWHAGVSSEIPVPGVSHSWAQVKGEQSKPSY